MVVVGGGEGGKELFPFHIFDLVRSSYYRIYKQDITAYAKTAYSPLGTEKEIV